MAAKRLARLIGVCLAGVLLVVVVTLFPVGSDPSPSEPPSYGLLFDGEDVYVRVPHDASLDIAGAITIEAWVKNVDNSAWSSIAGRRHDTWWQDDYGVVARNDGNSALYTFRVTDTDGNTWGTGTYLADIDSEWHHVAGTFDGRHLRLYFDGELKLTRDTEAQRNLAASGYDLLMGDYFGQMLNATVSSVRIWDVSRPEGDIRADMYRELVGTEAGLVGYWKLNEGPGVIARDSTAHGNHGIVHGSPVWIGGE